MAPETYRQLQDKHVLVLGGTSGIGFAVAEAALSYGARITVASSSQERIDKTVARLKELYGEKAPVQGFPIDLSHDDDEVENRIETLFKQATTASPTTHGGTVHHVVMTAANNPGIAPLSEASRQSILAHVPMMLLTPVLLAKVAQRYLPKSSASSLTFTSGQSTDRPPPGWSIINYYAGGVETLSRSLAVDIAPIRVNVVRPGMVLTERWKYVDEEGMKMYRKLGEKLPVGAMGKPEDVAESYIWLMKDKFVTGSHASTNGGVLLV